MAAKKIFKWRPFRKRVYLSSILTGGRHVQMYFIHLLSLSSKFLCINGNYCSMGEPYLHNLLPSWSNWVHFIQFIPLFGFKLNERQAASTLPPPCSDGQRVAMAPIPFAPGLSSSHNFHLPGAFWSEGFQG